MRCLAINFAASLMVADMNLTLVFSNPDRIQFKLITFNDKIKNYNKSYCFPSPSLQLGQVHATRRKRGFAGVELLFAEAGVSVVITTSMVVASA